MTVCLKSLYWAWVNRNIEMKTIAIIATADTKAEEMDFVEKFIQSRELNTLSIDVSTRVHDGKKTDIGPKETAWKGGFSEKDFLSPKTKSEAIEMMRESAANLVRDLYAKGKIDGIIGFGGLQNSLMVSSAMNELPIGFPKLIVSTVASGNRRFGLLTGAKDIVVLPSIADLAGLNPLVETILTNAASAIVGMVKYGGGVFSPKKLLIGATIMGATNDGIEDTIKMVRKNGFDVVTFHSTGVGGATLESLILEGKIQAVMDLCLHEIVSEDVFGAGFSVGAKNRLAAAVTKQIPMVLSPAGLDFIDFDLSELEKTRRVDLETRKYTLHNKGTVHIKLTPAEAKAAADVVVRRLENYTGEAAMIMPLQGMRSETLPGEKLHEPEVDEAIFETFRTKLNKNIRIIELDCHLSSPEFSRAASETMIELLRRR